MKRKLHVIVAFIAVYSVAHGAEFTWKGGAGARWDAASSYEENAVPSAGDTVTIPRDGAATVGDDEIAFVGALGAIVLDVLCSVTFDIAADATIRCAIHLPFSDISSYTREVYAVKKGAGTLTFAAPYDAGDANRAYLYRTAWRVEAGNLVFSADVYGSASATASFIRLDLAAGCTVDVSALAQFNVGQLFGDGTIDGGETATLMLIQRTNNHSSFSGKITGNIELRSTADGSSIDLSGTQSDFTTFYTYGTGTAYIRKFGNEGEPSSIGTNGIVDIRQNGGRLAYTGEGETTDKRIWFAHSGTAPVIDGGAHGGLVLAGQIGNYTGAPAQRRLFFDGSNTTECVFSGQFVERDRDGTNYSTYITKAGSGVWRFADNIRRRNLGVVAVRGGTLRFDSLAETNVVCSLGLATELYSDTFGTPRLDEWKVPYALLAGGEGGTFEYTGAAAVDVATRPLAVEGFGRIRNATECDFRLKGVSGLGEGGTLALGGDSVAAYNRLDDVTDSGAPLSLVKEGAGTWTLGGELSFSGDVAVSNGTLVVTREPPHATWFRLVVKESYHQTLAAAGKVTLSASVSREFQMQEFALYDADGVRRNAGLAFVSGVSDLSALQAGQVAYEAGKTGNNEARGPQCLFDETYSGTGWHGVSPATGTSYLAVNSPASWVKLVMRLADDAPEIVAYDFANATAVDNQRQIYAYAVECSSDGRHWTSVADVVGAPATAINVWNSDGSTPAKGETREGKGYAISTKLRDAVHVFDNVTSVSVAPGATLKADVRDGGEIALKGLRADASATGGVGTIHGFAFAETGALDITDIPYGAASAAIPLAFENCTGLKNVAAWTLTYRGEPTARIAHGVRNGTVMIFRTGLRVLIR